MTVASEGLHAAIVEKRLRHPGHTDLDRHVASAVAKKTGRGWRLDKAARDSQIDAVVALAMAVERAQYQPEPAQIVGWL
jgi:phage terminase large subunit-like protein